MKTSASSGVYESKDAAYASSMARIDEAISRVLRVPFIEEPWQMRSFEDVELPAGATRSCPAPSDVRALLAAAELEVGDRTLVVLPGTGYLAAVAFACGAVVDVWEPNAPLSARWTRTRDAFGWGTGDVFERLDPERIREYDRVLVGVALPRAPRSFVSRLRPHARLVVPVAQSRGIRLQVFRPGARATTRKDHGPVAFGRLIGAAAHADALR